MITEPHQYLLFQCYSNYYELYKVLGIVDLDITKELSSLLKGYQFDC